MVICYDYHNEKSHMDIRIMRESAVLSNARIESFFQILSLTQ